ncbi:MAG: ABC transporter substrate-binding protein [Proteobacteria bacterium]|nr:ABC transporter substrate-binding protein [Pseudomonadota bacterium]
MHKQQTCRFLARSAAAILAFLSVSGTALTVCCAAAAAEVAQLRIGVQFGIGYLPIYVAHDAGLFDKNMVGNGLDPVPVTISHVAGAPQINDGLLSGTMEVGSGGITAMMVAWEKTKAAKNQAMKGMIALSSLPYELLTVDPSIKSLGDLSERNKIGLPAITVSIPAIFLQMAAERIYGPGNHNRLDRLTVSLAQPDGATSLLSRGGTVDSYIFAPPFNYQLRERPDVHRVWSSTELTGGAITSLVMWTTLRFRDENPKTYRAVIAAIHEAIGVINRDRRRAAEIFVKAEDSKLPIGFVTEILGKPDLNFDTAPRNSLDLARFIARTGLTKTQPTDWRDYFFPEIHNADGS